MAGKHNPKVYVGTYGKYNDGSLKGKWVSLGDFDSYDEFMEYCRKLHSDESDPEFMFQDTEDVPSAFYSESHIAPEFWEFLNDDIDEDVKWAIVEELGDYDSYESKKDDIYVFYDCFDMSDVAAKYVEDAGGIKGLGEDFARRYFDYESYGRDVALEWTPDEDEPESVYEMYGVAEGDDEALGEQLIEDMGWDGVDLDLYFDYDEFGRAMKQEGTFVRFGDYENGGLVEIF